mgnify:FL=1
MKNGKIYIPVVDPDTGEHMILIKNKIQFTGNNSKFIKFYFPLIDLLHILSTSEIILIQYICHNIGINKDTIKISKSDTELKKTAFYSAINNLIKLNIISKMKYQDIYRVNKEMFFNGKK